MESLSEGKVKSKLQVSTFLVIAASMVFLIGCDRKKPRVAQVGGQSFESMGMSAEDAATLKEMQKDPQWAQRIQEAQDTYEQNVGEARQEAVDRIQQDVREQYGDAAGDAVMESAPPPEEGGNWNQ